MAKKNRSLREGALRPLSPGERASLIAALKFAAVTGPIWYFLGRLDPRRRKPKTGKKNGSENGTGAAVPPPEANYGPAHTPARSCGNCFYASPITAPPGSIGNPLRSEAPKVHCALWKADVYASYVCDRWRTREKPGETV